LKAFDDAQDILHKLKTKNRTNNPLLNFLQETEFELHSLIPPDFPELYSFERMKELPRYLKAHTFRMERASLNLAAAEKKVQEIQIYNEKLIHILIEVKPRVIPAQAGIQDLSKDDFSFFTYINKSDILMVFSEEKKSKIEELFWMIEEYKVSLFAQELKTPYPVSPKKLNQLIKEIEDL
jgi:ATP-dependent helicase HrpA